MLEVILKQKIALAAYATEYGDIQHLSPSQLNLIRKVVKVLSYIEEITKFISALVSMIIPFIHDLRSTLEILTKESVP